MPFSNCPLCNASMAMSFQNAILECPPKVWKCPQPDAFPCPAEPDYKMVQHGRACPSTHRYKYFVEIGRACPPYALKYHIGVQKGMEGYQEDIGHNLEVSKNEILFYSGKWVLATWFWPFSRISDIWNPERGIFLRKGHLKMFTLSITLSSGKVFLCSMLDLWQRKKAFIEEMLNKFEDSWGEIQGELQKFIKI